MSDKKPMVIFVHGFGSDAETWADLQALVMKDADLTAEFDFRTFEYPTQWINLNPWEKIPSLGATAKLLEAELTTVDYADRDLVLVGHSQGGLVIQKFISSKLSEGKGRQISKIRQVITFATPNRGSEFVAGLRKLFFAMFFNPQEKALRVLNDDIHEMGGRIAEQVVNARTAGDSTMPIPFVAFGGIKDKIVTGPSAQGSFPEYSELPGNHFSILNPTDAQDLRYRKFKEALLDPPGHKSVFEIATYETEISVQPYTAGPEDEEGEILLKPGYSLGSAEFRGKSRAVQANTKGRLYRKVRLARRNRRLDNFDIRYKTLDEGLVISRHSPNENQAKPSAVSDYEQQGVQVTFEFTPGLQDESYLDLDIYKGFDDGNQNVHFHLGRGGKNYRRLSYKLDLSAIIAAGRRLDSPPKLYYDHEEPPGSCTEVCKNQREENVLKPTSAGDGRWEWRLRNVRGGIVSIKWRASSPEGKE